MSDAGAPQAPSSARGRAPPAPPTAPVEMRASWLCGASCPLVRRFPAPNDPTCRPRDCARASAHSTAGCARLARSLPLARSLRSTRYAANHRSLRLTNRDPERPRRRAGLGRVLLGRENGGREPGQSGGDDERSAGALERRAERCEVARHVLLFDVESISQRLHRRLTATLEESTIGVRVRGARTHAVSGCSAVQEAARRRTPSRGSAPRCGRSLSRLARTRLPRATTRRTAPGWLARYSRGAPRRSTSSALAPGRAGSCAIGLA